MSIIQRKEINGLGDEIRGANRSIIEGSGAAEEEVKEAETTAAGSVCTCEQ